MWVRGLKLMTHSMKRMTITVAPYVGAWIETSIYLCSRLRIESHPMWVRGLKLVAICSAIVAFLSHPMWVRGLKHQRHYSRSVAGGRTLCGCVD